MQDRGMTIGAVAERSGVSTQAIRYYEREGLLPAPERTHTGYRMYGPGVLGRLNFIRQARSLGLSLKEIEEIFRMSTAGRAPCCQVRELLSGKLEVLNNRIAELSRFRDDLRRFLNQLSGVPDQTDASQRVCTLIEMAPSSLSPLGPSREPPARKTARRGKSRQPAAARRSKGVPALPRK